MQGRLSVNSLKSAGNGIAGLVGTCQFRSSAHEALRHHVLPKLGATLVDHGSEVLAYADGCSAGLVGSMGYSGSDVLATHRRSKCLVVV